jgi:hypothetical protein
MKNASHMPTSLPRKSREGKLRLAAAAVLLLPLEVEVELELDPASAMLVRRVAAAVALRNWFTVS